MRTFSADDKKGTDVESNRRTCSGSEVELEWLAEVQEVLQCVSQEVQEAALRNYYNCSITPLRVWVSLILVHRTRFIISKPETEIVSIISAQRMGFGLNSQDWRYQKFKIGLSKASKIVLFEFFTNYTKMARLAFLSLLHENKKIQWQNVTPSGNITQAASGPKSTLSFLL